MSALIFYKATLEKAAELAKLLEPIANNHGYHIGIGGGTINKEGKRKDIDVLVYRRRIEIKGGRVFNMEALFKAFEAVGLTRKVINSFPEMWCTKCSWQDIDIDVLYPESTHEGLYGDNAVVTLEGLGIKS